MAKTLPTARTLAWLRKDGWTCGVVEKWIAQTKQRKDLFGGIDIIAIKKDHPVLGVQATTTTNQSTRVKKMLEIPELKLWCEAGNLLWVVGWSQKGKAGKRKLWTASVTDLQEHF
jgi:hypothetical protein